MRLLPTKTTTTGTSSTDSSSTDSSNTASSLSFVNAAGVALATFFVVTQVTEIKGKSYQAFLRDFGVSVSKNQINTPNGEDIARLARWDKYNTTYHHNKPDPHPLVPSAECGSGPEFDPFFQLPHTVHSRLAEDRIVYNNFFRGRNVTGTYIELGAFDGQAESNTHFFDACLGWKGLLIEGNPAIYPRTKANRPHTHRMSFAPSCLNDSAVQFHPSAFTNAGLEGHALAYKDKFKTVSVPCGPFGPVLEDVFEGQSVNFFSLDVEGSETKVLKTIDFSRIQIDVLMIEVYNSFCQKECESRDEIRAIMKQAGYQRYEGMVQASDIYVRPDSPFVVADRKFDG